MRVKSLALPLLLGTSLAMTLPAATPDLAELNRMIARFAPAELKVDTSKLSIGDQQALKKLIEAAKVIDKIFLDQRWTWNTRLEDRLKRDTSPLGAARLHYFYINKGPWSELDAQTAFLPGTFILFMGDVGTAVHVPAKKLPGANFYPEDMTKDEFETWAAKLSKSRQDAARGFFTIIRRDPDKKLTIIPYSRFYAADVERAAQLLLRLRRTLR
jgi:hypothetical protein